MIRAESAPQEYLSANSQRQKRHRKKFDHQAVQRLCALSAPSSIERSESHSNLHEFLEKGEQTPADSTRPGTADDGLKSMACARRTGFDPVKLPSLQLPDRGPETNDSTEFVAESDMISQCKEALAELNCLSGYDDDSSTAQNTVPYLESVPEESSNLEPERETIPKDLSFKSATKRKRLRRRFRHAVLQSMRRLSSTTNRTNRASF